MGKKRKTACILCCYRFTSKIKIISNKHISLRLRSQIATANNFSCNYFVFCLLLFIFAQTNLNITTLRLRKLSCSELNFKEVHAIPPMTLDVTGHGKPSHGAEKPKFEREKLPRKEWFLNKHRYIESIIYNLK